MVAKFSSQTGKPVLPGHMQSLSPFLTVYASDYWVSLGLNPFLRKVQYLILRDDIALNNIFSRYISVIKPQAYPAVLRNLIIGALIINVSVLVTTYAILPTDQILSGANILSLVGQAAGGTWLRKVVVVDSAIVVS